MESLQLALILVATVWCVHAENITTLQDTDSRPYLLVATSNSIIRMDLNGSNVTTLVTDSGITAIDYHYRLNLVFWVTQFAPDLKYASLTDGSNVEALGIREIQSAAGLAVDWIHDKVYWDDRELKAIYEYDLNSKQTTKVKDIPDSNPSKLKIFPQSSNSLLYMGDLERNGIYRIPLNGSNEEKMIDTDCPYSHALDYRSRDLYWLDGCNYHIGTSKIDGSLKHVIKTGENTYFPYGASMFENHIYWAETGETSTVYCYETKDLDPEVIYSARNLLFRDIQIVHFSNQPSMLELGELGTCQLECVHGSCVQPGVCSCDEGWTGPGCSIDESFPSTTTSSIPSTAPHTTSTPATAPHTTSTPATAPHTTSTPATAPHTTPTPSTAPHTTPTPATAPHTTSTPATAPHTTSTPATAPHTTSTPATAPHTTPTIPHTTATTAAAAATTAATATPPLQTTPTTANPASLPTTTTPELRTSPAGGDLHTTTSQPSVTPDDQDTITTTTTTSHHDSITPASNTDQGTLSTEEDGLQVDQNSTPLILAVVFSAFAVIIIVTAAMYIFFIVVKCKQRKKGSYNVHVRHQQRTARLNSSAELGTSSVNSSFRDITEQYRRERFLQGVLGFAGNTRSPSHSPSEASSACGLIVIVQDPALHNSEQIEHV